MGAAPPARGGTPAPRPNHNDYCYKRQIMNHLAQRDTDSIDSASTKSVNEYKNFDDFAQRSSRDEW
ncbi:hypothetical protein [Leptothermofonsia sp. ETS-13]|uniref:hypothetical protein n=1 Tax=Leptothermofonsia sp. ETS-13 TaxID=3035696 RepID=UPI003B9F6787